MVLTCLNINEVDVAVEIAKIFQNTKLGEFTNQRHRKQDKDNYSS